MNEGLKKFEELLKTDPEFQAKLKLLVENYKGESTEEAFFNEVLVPFAKEYGISASYEEYQEYIHGQMNVPLSEEEMKQVAGGNGTGKGYGGIACSGIGLGLGGGGGSGTGGGCYFLGGGWGGTACWKEGTTVGLFD